ncbi:glycoside hydrolase family 38 N-terminal domain-containing protein [Massiliimalia timonensis]|uniref:glycoside hydrolase family 38 N-terminal domain-containing protein n=1 Tax=Massiliimalia timonensis TaxID=1987501 RepID=UPI0018A07F95|nr:glycosyl hydrolase [Massiliimalia timonensis]
MKPKWKIYLIHHSHTDIGYTERQNKIARIHADYIRQAIQILDQEGKTRKEKKFVWQCENYWQVKNFYQFSDLEEQEKFESYVRQGQIGLSGNYLNMTDLAGDDILWYGISQAKRYAQQIGAPLTSAMAADVNGFSWGYADILAEAGIENLFTCVHTHHGMYPGERTQLPFWWKGPKGNKILVWSGEHYNLANEFNLAPHTATTYMIQDHYANIPLYQTDSQTTEEEELTVCKDRLFRYLSELKQKGYPYQFIPLMISGTITDNAPPSAGILDRIMKIEERYPDTVQIEMVTLDQFFTILRKETIPIETYHGDWTDWWADGVGSTPKEVKTFRKAQRAYETCLRVDPSYQLGKKEWMDNAAENLLLFAEHTWGYSSSVNEPWETMVSILEQQKKSYAAQAMNDSTSNLDLIQTHLGEKLPAAGRELVYRVINPYPTELSGPAKLFVDFWEYLDGIRFSPDIPLQIIDEESGQNYPYTIEKTARAYQLNVSLSLRPNEKRDLRIVRAETVLPKPIIRLTADQTMDLAGQPLSEPVFQDTVETPDFIISLDPEKGITNMIDKLDDTSLLKKQAKYPFGCGVYEVTRGADPCQIRKKMGRNRKALNTKRYFAKLTERPAVFKTELYYDIFLNYQLNGTNWYRIKLRAHLDSPKLTVTVRLHKHSEHDPENLYVSFPLTAGAGEEQFIDKSGCIVRPGVDQLPQSNQDFYALQEGVVLKGKNKTVLLCMPDTPLVTFGMSEASAISTFQGNKAGSSSSEIFSWPMNNFWETNFNADLGGFYEFEYTVLRLSNMEVQQAFSRCKAENSGLICFHR